MRAIAASNFTAERLRSALEISRRDGLAEFVALQPHYNLVERAEFETSLLPLLESEGLSCMPYYGLREGLPDRQVPRRRARMSTARAPRAPWRTSTTAGARCSRCWTRSPPGTRCRSAAVALAWLAAQPTVVAPIASARTTEQLADLLPVLDLKLTDDEVRLLSHVSA